MSRNRLLFGAFTSWNRPAVHRSSGWSYETRSSRIADPNSRSGRTSFDFFQVGLFSSFLLSVRGERVGVCADEYGACVVMFSKTE